MVYTVHGILQARMLERLAFPSPGDLPNPGIELRSPALQVDSLPAEPSGKPQSVGAVLIKVPWNLLLSSGDWTSEIRGPGWQDSGENPLPGCS